MGKWIFLFLLCHSLGVAASLTREIEVAAHCPAGVDHLAGSRLYWDACPAETTAWLRCPQGAAGNITRECKFDKRRETGGRWKEPDVTKCHNEQMKSFYQTSSDILSRRGPPVQQVMGITYDMRDIVTQAAGNDTLYPVDLIGSSSLLYDIARVVDTFGSISSYIQEMSEEYCETLSVLADNMTLDTWTNFQNYDAVSLAIGKLLDATEMMAENLLKTQRFCTSDICKWSHIRAVTENLDFELISLKDTYHNSTNITLSSPGAASAFVFPEEIINISRQAASKGCGLYRAEFKSLKPLLTLDPLQISSSDAQQSLLMNSYVAAAKILGVDSVHFANVTSPIVVILQHEFLLKEYHGTCFFMNTSATSQLGRWLHEGCEAADSNDTHTICHCYHLTNFALIMDIYGVNFSKGHDLALTSLTYIGGVLSILGCLISIIVYCHFRLSSERIKIHGMLATSIILSQLFFFVGFDRTENTYVCKTFAILLHYALTAMFCWMLVEGIHLYVSLVKVFPTGPHFHKYLVIGWGIPMLDVTLSVATSLDEYAVGDHCWLSNKLLLITFIPFVAMTILVNTIILIMVLRVMVKSRHLSGRFTNDELPTAKSGLKATIVLLPLLGLTWVFGFLSVGTEGTLIFTYLFTICNSLQGVFFFLFHCLLNCEVRREYEKRQRHKKATEACAAKFRAPHNVTPDSETKAIVGDSLGPTAKKRPSALSTESGDTNTTGTSVEETEGIERRENMADDNGNDVIATTQNESEKPTGEAPLATPECGIQDEDDDSDNGYFEDPEIRDALWAMDSIFDSDVTPHPVELYITHI